MSPITNRTPPRIQTTPRAAPRTPAARTAPAQARAQPQSLLQQGVSFFEQNRTNATRLVTSGLRANTLVNDARNAYRRGNPNRGPVSTVRNSTSTFGRLTRPARIGGGLYGTVNNAARLPGQTATAFRDIRQAFRSGNAADRVQAERSSRTALSNASTLADTAAATRRNARAGSFAVRRIAQTRAPALAARVGGVATRIAESSAARIAGRVLTSGAARTTAAVAGRALGRFVPGANVAIAALDAREAYRAIRDPNASTGRRITSVVTALGSAAAATNIPVVSQIGAAVSVLSSAIGAFFS